MIFCKRQIENLICLIIAKNEQNPDPVEMATRKLMMSFNEFLKYVEKQIMNYLPENARDAKVSIIES